MGLLNLKSVVVDIGNSAIKFAVCESLKGAGWTGRGQVELASLFESGQLPEFDWMPNSAANWLACSVNQEAYKLLEAWVAKHRPDDRLARITNLDFPWEIVPERIEMIGTDRLAAAAGAIDLVQDEQVPPNLIVIDAGTAVTIDGVDSMWRFLGGTIRPGVRLQRSSLHLYTDALPDLSHDERNLPDNVFGQTTDEAILSGIGFGELGAIMSVAQVMEDQFEGETQVLITGGGAKWMQPFLPEDWQLKDDLVLHGIRVIAREQVSDSAEG